MGEWQESVLGGLCAGVLVAVLAFHFRGAARKWTGGGRLAVLIVVAVALGATAPALLLPPTERHLTWPEEDVLTRIAAELKSGDLSERMAALDEVHRLARIRPTAAPEIVELLSAFVRDRAPEADDLGCASSKPAEDVDAALAVLRVRSTVEDAAVDLHGTCLANTDLRSLSAPRGKFAGVNLTGANVKAADLTGADLHDANLAGTSLVGTNLVDTLLFGARFADTNLEGAHFSDDTLWPPQHEDAVMAASSFATTDFVIGELVLSDPR